MQTTKVKTIGSGMMLTERDRRIVEAIAEFGIVTRDQIAKHLKFGSVTRANTVLLRLARNRYLSRRLQPTLRGTRRLTYFVGPVGDELLGLSSEDGPRRRRWAYLSDLFIEHQLAVNDLRLVFEHRVYPGYEFLRWMSERELAPMNLRVVPDAYCEYRLDGRSYAIFIEVDRGTESHSRWTQKVNAYLGLAFGGTFEERFGRRFFRVLVTTPSQRRLAGVAREIAKRTDQIFWLAEHDDLVGNGPFGVSWRRPAGSDLYSLTNQ
jgi:hypothetical protein